MKNSSSVLYSLSLSLCAVACSDDEASVTALPENAADAISTYSQIVYASYQDSLATAEELDAAANALVATPSAATQEAAQDAWRASREPYLQTEVYRFYGGPIDDDDGPEGRLNAWPLDENHIDYVMDDPDAGIVNDPQETISAAALIAANESPGEKDIATGYHAVEFLLWGQDFADDGPGARPYTDYMTTGGTNANQARRGQYLTTASGLIVSDLEGLVEAWAPTSRSYRTQLENEDPAEALTKIMSAMLILSGFETGGERLLVALEGHLQEDEHSCFSDNTDRDMVQDVRGVQNVWLGRYEPVDGATIEGTGLYDVVAAADPAMADHISEHIAESLAAAEAIQPPFDQEIKADNAAGNARVQRLSNALFDQVEALEEAFELFGLSRIPDPE